MTKNLYLLIGPSGAGKTTVMNELCKRFGYKEFWSYTTRKPRVAYELGHRFVLPEEFDKIPDFVEQMEYNGAKYGTTLWQCQHNDIGISEINGARKIKSQALKIGKPVKVIVIYASETEAIARMVSQGDPTETIRKKAMADADFRGGLWDLWDFWVYNRDLERTVDLVQKYIEECEAKAEECEYSEPDDGTAGDSEKARKRTKRADEREWY